MKWREFYQLLLLLFDWNFHHIARAWRFNVHKLLCCLNDFRLENRKTECNKQHVKPIWFFHYCRGAIRIRYDVWYKSDGFLTESFLSLWFEFHSVYSRILILQVFWFIFLWLLFSNASQGRQKQNQRGMKKETKWQNTRTNWQSTVMYVLIDIECCEPIHTIAWANCTFYHSTESERVSD